MWRRTAIMGMALCTLYALAGHTQTSEIPEIVVRPNERDAGLMLRGAKALLDRDIIAARLLFGLAARDGQVDAARRMAELYNPAWLASIGMDHWETLGDPVTAIDWYKRAAELGDTQPGNLYVEAQ